jgi:LmbE family N-acetylglucosaminyl deacetylase
LASLYGYAMLNLSTSIPPKTILLLGAHCDDIEIGCAGTVLNLTNIFPDAHFEWIIFSSSPARAQEAICSANRLLASAISKNVLIENFRNGYFPYIGEQIKDYFESLKNRIIPDLILTHHLDDRHQDHRTLAELTWNTFRDQFIMEYEIPKYDGGLGTPNCFIPITRENADVKISTLMDCFVSEAAKPWFTPETFNAMLRLRGVESNSPTGLAEAYYCRKILLNPLNRANKLPNVT